MNEPNNQLNPNQFKNFTNEDLQTIIDGAKFVTQPQEPSPTPKNPKKTLDNNKKSAKVS